MQDNHPSGFYRAAAVAAGLQLVLILLMLVGSFALGAAPATVQEYFDIYAQGKLTGLLRDDFSSVLMIAMYLGTLPGLYFGLRRVSHVAAGLGALGLAVGVAVCFANNSAFSMMHLSDLYQAAASAAEQERLLAAGEAVLATNMWHTTGGYMSGILLQGVGVVFSLLMLRTRNFGRVTAISGLIGNGLDLIQHLLHPFALSISAAIAPVMGIFYLVWFPALMLDFIRLARREKTVLESE